MEQDIKKIQGISCPLCGHADIRYRKTTDSYVCRHCEYVWSTIERCTTSKIKE